MRRAPAPNENYGPATTTGWGWRAEHGLAEGEEIECECRSVAGVDSGQSRLTCVDAHPNHHKAENEKSRAEDSDHVISKAARTRAACGVWSLEPVGLVRSQDNLAHVDGYPKSKANDSKGEKAEGGGHGSALGFLKQPLNRQAAVVLNSISKASDGGQDQDGDVDEAAHSGHLRLVARVSSSQGSTASISDADKAGLDVAALDQPGIGFLGGAVVLEQRTHGGDDRRPLANTISAMQVRQRSMCGTAATDEVGAAAHALATTRKAAACFASKYARHPLGMPFDFHWLTA